MKIQKLTCGLGEEWWCETCGLLPLMPGEVVPGEVCKCAVRTGKYTVISFDASLKKLDDLLYKRSELKSESLTKQELEWIENAIMHAEEKEALRKELRELTEDYDTAQVELIELKKQVLTKANLLNEAVMTMQAMYRADDFHKRALIKAFQADIKNS